MNASSFPLELKSLAETGQFTGFAAIYGTVDQGGDIIEPGAIAEIEATADGQIRILNSHIHAQPVGKGRLVDGQKGLTLNGRLNLAVQAGRDAYELLRDGILTGLSIGYSVLSGGAQLKENTRRLTRLKLWEVSLCAFPMHPDAQVVNVKAADCADIREYESLLRSQGFSARGAKRLAAGGWSAYQRKADAEDDRDDRPDVLITVRSHHPDATAYQPPVRASADEPEDFSALMDGCARFSKQLRKGICNE